MAEDPPRLGGAGWAARVWQARDTIITITTLPHTGRTDKSMRVLSTRRSSSKLALLLSLVAAAACRVEPANETEADLIERARGIHERVITLDTHNDISAANFTAERNYTMDLGNQVNLPNMEAGASRSAIAQSIINAFGVGYDNQTSGLQATDVQVAIDEVEGRIDADETVEAALEARVDALEFAKNTTPCDPNGDGMITAEELLDRFRSYGFSDIKLSQVVNVIWQSEVRMTLAVDMNGMLDTSNEIAYFNAYTSAPGVFPHCPNP